MPKKPSPPGQEDKASGAQATSLRDGLVAHWWALDEHIAAHTLYSQANRFDAVLGPGSSNDRFTGEFGRPGGEASVLFNGGNSRMTVPSAGTGSELLILGSMTWAAWVRHFSLPGLESTHAYISHGDTVSTNASRNFAYWFGVYNDVGIYRFRAYHQHGSGVNNEFLSTSGFTINRWNHIAWVRNAVPEYRLFVNGVLSSTHAISNLPTNGSLTIPIIGSRDGDALNGVQDDMIVWNRALGDGEVYDLYERGSQPRRRKQFAFTPDAVLISSGNRRRRLLIGA